MPPVPLALAPEFAVALRKGAPLVALESSVIAHGLPYPHNLETALRCEAAVREAGAVPATIAVLDGRPTIGLTSSQIERLAKPSSRWLKLGSSDLAVACTRGLTGGTTVSATTELAARAGIRVFATGGIGGVHRGPELDVSQDLWAISRFPVAVVSAGAKVLLDLPRTLEALEALGVPVVGYQTDDFPGFVVRRTGLALTHSVSTPAEAAALIHTRLDRLQQGGLLLCVPPPTRAALGRIEVERILGSALALARRRGVRGKALTPFLLGELSRRSGERTLKANLALLVQNASVGGAVAAAMTTLSRPSRSRRSP